MKSDAKRAAARAEREDVLRRIAALEAAGGDSFFVDVEPDPPGHPLAPDEVDYLQARLSNRIKSFFARRLAAVKWITAAATLALIAAAWLI